MQVDESEPRIARLLWWIVLAGQLVVPLFVLNSSFDVFRAPKYVVFRTEAILLLALLLIALVWGKLTFPSALRDRAMLFTMLAIGWTVICVLFSANRRVGVDSLITLIAAATIFITIRIVAPRHGFASFDVMLAAAVVNGVLGVLQLLAIWRPFLVPDPRGKYAMTGLVGTSNDLGMLLLAPSVVALALCLVTRGARRAIYAIVALVLALSLLAAQSLAAIVAFAVALLLLAVTAYGKRALLPITIAAAVMLIALMAYAPMRQRLNDVRSAAREHRYNDLTSLRVPPFLSAGTMFLRHPLTGVGPGGFHSQYMSYRIELSRRYPQLMASSAAGIEIFGEVHNDHLQLLAETGLPGYALLLAFCAFIAAPSLRRRSPHLPAAARDDSPRVRFCRIAALPLVGSFLVLALAQFPMQVAAASLEYLFIAGVCVAWREADV